MEPFLTHLKAERVVCPQWRLHIHIYYRRGYCVIQNQVPTLNVSKRKRLGVLDLTRSKKISQKINLFAFGQIGLFPGVLVAGAALTTLNHLYCPKLDCSAHNMAALLYSELCNTVTHVPAPPGYVLLQQPFISNIVEKQRCREVNVELLSRQESPLEPWRPGNWERPPRKTDLSLSQEESQVSWICCKRLKNGSITSRQSIPICWISFARFHDTIKWKPFYSESWTLQKTFSPLVYPPSPSACP